MIETIASVGTAVAAILAVAVFVFKRGRDLGQQEANHEDIKKACEEIADAKVVITGLRQSIKHHSAALDRGTAQFDKMWGDISSLNQRCSRIEGLLNGKRFPAENPDSPS